MKKHKVSRFFFIVSFIGLLFYLLYFTLGLAFSRQLTTIARYPLTSLDAFISKPILVVKNSLSELRHLNNTFLENKQLRKELRKQNLSQQYFEELLAENKRLKNLLSLSATVDKWVSAEVISRNPYQWYDSLQIKTAKKVLQPNSLVLSGEGIIGKVTSANRQAARVELLTCGKEVNIPIKIVDKNKIIYGNLKYFQIEEKRMLASEFNSNEAIDLGAKVYTSGLDGETQANLPVGKVIGFKNSSDKLKRQLLIKLFADFDHLDNVLVVGIEK
ncbi:UNVERIFIED_CONTAM: rod shape-determining protein MreC [Streptococcus canis]|uniref:Cell shape-determining protein MreC n=2 Tax=Streptococcus canis TaxID=1329 RepID=A0AAE4Q7I2_STRCB|nr:rod shape-determining protein MreC [Streptococcus canis]EIQ80799.1 rod shape-determining protein MreC [Streptococcus canis FSL Z3-227]MDV5977467.1 rod shape-determining protein MreC [Streptococcus canis]MDV5989203.1 rod shape-determining protein MreC [Streptococcus canis]MDV5994370.1 rod shape-determining protein MreC [Streptococcus canis]MDV6001982.1 rod shape-determining protein MreC [Streptococcus canis]